MVSNTPLASPLRVIVLMPLRDDWASAAELTRRLDQVISAYPCTVDVLLVDDGSIQAFRSADFQSRFAVVRSVRILRLRRNLGHQRAIAIGLVYIEKTIPCDAVLVMDSDGEDTPEGALELLRAFSGTNAIFAERSRRTESLVFRLFYRLYKLLHRMFTGISVRVGNFSILPSRYLGTLVVMSELWNHYAAAVFRSGLAFTTIPIARGHRIAGKSRMNFVSLTAHGMSAISVFGDVVGVRLLITCMAGSLLAALGILAVVAIRIFTDRAIPGWATYSILALIIILIQFITMATSFTFTMLSNRINLSFVPLRDYELFVAEIQKIDVQKIDVQDEVAVHPPQ
jgi:polyisoprenyl-phosphate glycosyltransferase